MAVSVSCRIRPRVPKADAVGGQDVLSCDVRSVQARMDTAGRASVFSFDNVFDPSASQTEVFDKVARPLVDAALGGINVTVAVYGQTGSGKTHTMMGKPSDAGISPRVVECIFSRIEASPDTMEYTIKVSMLEIYMERVRDLLSPDRINLAIRQDPVRGIFVDGAVEEYVASADELLQIVRMGDANRAVASTGMNDISSRSHSVVIITLEVRDTVSRSLQMSKLYLVDLAGSESVSRTGAEGITLDEARMINKSLFNLSKVINSLASMSEGSVDSTPTASDGASTVGTVRRALHVPYRDSKLTRLLQDSLGGNAKMALIVCCSPCSSNLTETLSTLRFGTRASQVKNKPVVNRVRSVEELERLLAKAEIAIDAQGAFIRALQQQISDLTAAMTDDALERLNASPVPDDDALEGSSELTADKGPHSRAAGSPSMQASPPAVGVAMDPLALRSPVATSASAEQEAPPSAGSTRPPIVPPNISTAARAAPSSAASGVSGFPLPSADNAKSASSGHSPHIAGIPDAAQQFSSPQNSARDSVRSRRGSRASIIDGSLGMAQLMELSALRDEVAQLRRAEAANVEELAAREDEVKSLTQLLASKEAAYERLQADREHAVATARAAGAEDAAAEALQQLRAFACPQCRGTPFAEIVDVMGACTVHEHTCFAAQEAAAAQKRVEERAAVLQAEVNDLKTFISANRIQEAPPPAPAPHPATPTRATTSAAAAPPPSSKDVVDIGVMQNLQGKLTALIHVHRQLLRKYAVVDVECGELNEAIKARDTRIATLTKAALSHNIAMDAMRSSYESRISDLVKDHQQQLLSLRRDLLQLRAPQHSVGARSASGDATTEDPYHGDDANGGTHMRSRHVVKPVRGAHSHPVAVTMAVAGRYRGLAPVLDVTGLQPTKEVEAEDDDEDDAALDGEAILESGGMPKTRTLPSTRINAMFAAVGGHS